VEKIDINQRYPEENEAGRPDSPYLDFFRVLGSTFNLATCSSVMDVGCADGNLIKIIKQNFNNVDVSGIEYFEYHKKYADSRIIDKIHFCDIRDPLPEQLRDKKFDIVICTEVGEHIDPDFCDAFLENVKSLTGGYLIMTWSCHGGKDEPHNDPLHQHLNPLSFDDFISLMDSKGFVLHPQASLQLINVSKNYQNFYHWWRESLTVWTKK
jgi:cyclopropane fatty-acyl-phospholipid synthase-like methyltransferase